jgi:NAD(P)H-hydrate repair Nnr-like enzyme with NAD(P)H-hydrate dehydratase domain
VIDAGALQMVDPTLLNKNCIITPHHKEFQMIYRKRVAQLTEILEDGSYKGEFEGESFETAKNWKPEYPMWFEDSILESMAHYQNLDSDQLRNFSNHYTHASKLLFGTTILTKGSTDTLVRWSGNYDTSSLEAIDGGNAGMTKGGTGDVLAGLVAGLYSMTDDPFAAAVVGSYVNKKAGDELFEKVGPFFNATDLADQIPRTLAEVFKLH